jgi:hypothetical protein
MLKHGRVTVSFYLLVSFAFTAIASARADGPVATNFDLMRDMATKVSEELVSGFPSGTANSQLRLAPVGRDEQYEFVGNMLTKSLTAKGYRAYATPSVNPTDSTGSASALSARGGGSALRLEFQLIDFSLRYTKIYRSFLIGGKKVKRHADVRILAKLVDPADGLVVWLGEASRSYDDHFSYGNIDEIETGLYEFTKPPRESRHWGKIVEPVVVSGIIVGLIYLFFSNQGD